MLASGIYDLFSGMSLPRQTALFVTLVAAVPLAVAALMWLPLRRFLLTEDDDSY
jgi:hypothetical protein